MDGPVTDCMEPGTTHQEYSNVLKLPSLVMLKPSRCITVELVVRTTFLKLLHIYIYFVKINYKIII